MQNFHVKIFVFFYKMTKRAIIIFQKFPELGKVKTRLAKTIGNENALKIYKHLVNHTHQVIKNVAADKFVFFADKVVAEGYEHCQVDLQEGDELGDRMKIAFEKVFSKGYQQVVIIGTDCNDLSIEIVDVAFDVLDKKDAVIGPALDGGYYLLGLSKMISAIFENKNWSTETVCSATEKDFVDNGFSYELITPLSDIDVEADLGPLAKLIEK